MEDTIVGDVTSDPKEMAGLLVEHWGRVLTSKPVDRHLLSRWLRDLQDKLPVSLDAWTLTHEHIRESLKRCHETAPGPDGIPYKAYKKLGNYASSFLFDVAEDLQELGRLTTCL